MKKLLEEFVLQDVSVQIQSVVMSPQGISITYFIHRRAQQTIDPLPLPSPPKERLQCQQNKTKTKNHMDKVIRDDCLASNCLTTCENKCFSSTKYSITVEGCQTGCLEIMLNR